MIYPGFKEKLPKTIFRYLFNSSIVDVAPNVFKMYNFLNTACMMHLSWCKIHHTGCISVFWKLYNLCYTAQRKPECHSVGGYFGILTMMTLYLLPQNHELMDSILMNSQAVGSTWQTQVCWWSIHNIFSDDCEEQLSCMSQVQTSLSKGRDHVHKYY